MEPVTSKIELAPDGKLFFLHIPKTAGTSLVSLLDNFYEQKEICQAYTTADLSQIPVPRLKKYRFFRGHMSPDTLEEKLGEKPQTITLLRHPVSHALSLFAYWRRRTDQEFLADEIRKFRLISLERYFQDPWLMHTRDYRNFQTRHLLTRLDGSRFETEAGIQTLPPYAFDPDKLNSQAAFELVQGFALAGLVERFEESLLLLAYTMGWQPPEHVPYLNKGTNRPEQHSLSQKLYDKISQASALDMELYNRTNQLFEQRLEGMTLDLLQRFATPAQARLKYPLPAEELGCLLEKHYRQRFVERNKPVSALRYDLDQPLPGRQWHERNLNPDHGVTRWSGPGPHSTLDLPLAASENLKIKFHVLAALTAEALDSLKLDVEGQDIPLSRQVNPDTSTTFEGTLPRHLLAKSAGLTRLNFRLKHTVVPAMVDPGNKDPRQLGINLNWVEVYPATRQSATRPATSSAPTAKSPAPTRPPTALPEPPPPPKRPILGKIAALGRIIRAARQDDAPPHLLIIADVSNAETYHLGDEAMLEANLEKFRELWPNLALTVISNDPQWTARHYQLNAVGPFGFPGGAEEAGQREQLLQTLIEAAHQKLKGKALPAGTPGREIIERLAQVDAVIISGGGNLCSFWPGHVYERATLVRLAGLFGKPAFVFGQTLGPNLTLRERQLVQETLHQTRLVGVRERNSLDLAQSLGLGQDKIIYQLDDAFYLKSRPNPEWAEQLSLSRLATLPLILVTLAPFSEFEKNPGLLAALAEQLEEIAFDCGAGLVLVPHLARALDNPGLSDVALHTQLLRTFKPGTPVLNLNTGLAGEVRWLTGQANMVISMRYHPLVFAMAAGKAGLGIYTDSYTR